MRRLLVAEDDEVTRTLLAAVLRKEGYEVREVADGSEAARLGANEDFDLIILDLGLPGLGGIEACRRIRAARADAVVMFLTASGSELDAVAGLDAGAVDYVTKPFGVAELLARVRAHTRRVKPDELVAGRVRINRSARQAWLDEEELRLSPREFDLLEQLVSNAGRTVTRQQLVAALWGEWYGSPKTLDMHVLSLRRKLGDDASKPRHIITVRGVGLRFQP
jgi:DNA-binding response OmpR family regulator